MTDIPRPSRFTKHSLVDEVACELNRAHRSGATRDLIFDLEDFCRSVLLKTVVWNPIEEPPGRVCFAAITSDRIIINSNHKALFKGKPFLVRSALGHEAGHQTLRHLELLTSDRDQGSLFDDQPALERMFHDSSLAQLGLTPQDLAALKADLARDAVTDRSALDMLKKLEDKLEPEWMFWQAERFGASLLMPKDRVRDYLESGADVSRWPGIYQMGRDFGVSVSMTKVRLEKLQIIETQGKEIRLLPREQSSLDFA